MSTSSIPEEGDTKNVPEDGGALVTTTIEVETVETLKKKVSVAPAGRELAGRTRLMTTGDRAWVEGEIVAFTGVRARDPRLKKASSTDQAAKAAAGDDSPPWDGKKREAVRTSLVEGFTLVTADGIFDTRERIGNARPTTFTIKTTWLDR